MSLTLFWAIIKRSFRAEYLYKSNVILKIAVNVIMILILYSIWTNLFSATIVDEIDLPGMLTYVIASLFISNLVRFETADLLIEKIRDGSIVWEFVQPTRLLPYLAADQVGRNLFGTLFSTVPVCLTAVFALGISFSAVPLQWAIFMAAVLSGAIVKFMIDYCLGLCVFWLQTGVFIRQLSTALFELFGGTLIPLWFYPDSLRSIAMALPFRLVVFEPVAILLGRTAYGDAALILAIQWAWIAALLLLHRFLWRSAQRVVTVQGG